MATDDGHAVAAPYRELFVELPLAVFEALQGVGEVAVAEAQRKQAAPVPLRTPHWLYSHDHVRRVMRRYGWLDAVIHRDARTALLTIVVVMSCLHEQSYRLSDHEILRCSSRKGELWLLDCIVAKTPRSCFCVPWAEVDQA